MNNMFIEYNIKELVQRIKEGDISINEMIDMCIRRRELCKKYNAFASFSPELLKKEYDMLLHNSSLVGEKIFGIPIGVKDIINTKTYPTEMGSAIWKNFYAGNDARVVYNLKSQGGVVAGKTVTAEFAVHELNETLNPWDIERTPGTSSSGSAVAVSLGIVPVALGTQTAGSIIRPASFCGVFGYMPSFGLIPRTGVLKTTDSLDTIGMLTSRVDNLRPMLETLRVKGLDYPYVHKAFSDWTRQTRGNRKWKIAFVKTYTWAGADDYVKKSLLQLVENMKQDDEVEIVEQDIDTIISAAHSVHETIYDKSLSYYFKSEYKDKENMSDIMRRMIQKGNDISVESFLEALDKQEEMCHAMDEFMSKYDAVLTFSTASVAPMRHEMEKDDSSLIWTLLHLPAINIPAFADIQTGLPYGCQIVSRRYNDGLLLEFCEYLASKGMVPSKIKVPSI